MQENAIKLGESQRIKKVKLKYIIFYILLWY